MVTSIPANGRRAALRPAQRSAFRMQLERLEDRVVPSLADGTILVATGSSSFSTQDQSSFPTGIIAVDPNTGTQAPVSTGGLFALPTYIREAPNQQLYVTDLQAYGTGAIFRVDPNSGKQSLVTKGGLIDGPNILVYLNGFLYVANLGDSSGKVHDIVQVDPSTGAQKLISDGSGGGFSVPTSMTAADGHNIYVVDEPGNVQGADPGAIWVVNLDSGKQTRLVHGGLLDHPVDIAVEPNGDLIVGNTGSAANGYAGSVIRINPQTGAQTLVSSFGHDTGLDSLDLGMDGRIFVGAISNGSTPGRIYSVNAETGSQGIVSSGGSISLVEGIRVFRKGSGGATTADTTAVVSSVSPSVFGQSVTFTATIRASNPQAGTPTGTVQFQIDGSNAGNPVTVSTTGNVTTASFSTITLAVGSHSVTANYSGDSNFASSTGALAGGQSVTKARTSATVIASANPTSSGQAVTFTATVTVTGTGSPATVKPTGVVNFFDGGTIIAQKTLNNSGGTTTASISTSGLSAGNHTITAAYAGDNDYLTSTAGMIQTVNGLNGAPTISPVSTTTLLVVSALAAPLGQPITLLGIVSSSLAALGTNGSITFLDQGMPLANVPLNGQMATFTTSTLALGAHSLSAAYTGDPSHTASNSSAVAVIVGTSNQRFVGQLYQTLLQRPPESGGLAAWTANLDQGVSRANVAMGIEQSEESRTNQVQGLYHQFLHRSADPSGLKTFVTVLRAGGTLEQVSTVLTSSTEYLQTQGGGTKNGFVTALYRDTLNRSPEPAELAAYTTALNAGTSPRQVATGILGSTENFQNHVTSSYQEFLKRPADNGGLNSYVKAMRAGVLDQDNVATAMLSSDEFLSHV
jgi:hypothetical protein